jgi:hypothetical protein
MSEATQRSSRRSLEIMRVIWTAIGPFLIWLLFYLVFTPLALILRMSGKDRLGLKRDPAARSYWIERHPPGPDAQSMSNQY